MTTKIIKRNGRQVSYDPSKITEAIRKAGEATGEFKEGRAQRLSLKVQAIIENSDSPLSVEDVQDTVEEVLLASTFSETAKAYILYRDHHRRIREIVQSASIQLVDDYLNDIDWKVKENANKTKSPSGFTNYAAGEIAKVYWLENLYTKDVRDAHVSGDIHIHNLDFLGSYCVGWDLKDLITVGYTGVAGKLSSAPPKRLRTALGQAVNFLYTLTNEAAGALAFSNFDTLLAPFVHYNNLGEEEVYQAIQEFVFNLNVPTRSGTQTPFINLTLDLKCPETMKDEAVVIGGKLQDTTYGEHQKEMDIINNAFFKVLYEGDASQRVFTFPIPTINITKDFDWENPALEYLWKATAKYGIPYFSNFINSDMDVSDARSMCCRLRLDKRELRRRGGGLFGSNPLTGSLGVVTINLPRLGHLAENEGEFYELLQQQMQIAKQSLEIKRKVVEGLTENNFYPYTKFYLRSVKGATGKYWSNHFSTIGLVGMNEAAINLLGESLGENPGFAVRVLNFMRDVLQEYQEDTGNLYNLEATPGEGSTYRLARLDKQQYNMFQQGDGNIPYYTNSSQLPVDYTDDVMKILDLQDEIQSLYTGGTVQHIYLGEALADPEAVKQFIKLVFSNYKLPYLSLTPTFSICSTHGYLHGRHDTCPDCGAECEVYSRVVGYLRPVKNWNEYKRLEFEDRSSMLIPN